MRECDVGRLCDVVRGFFFGGLGLGSKDSESDSESLSLLLLVFLGGSGWSDFDLLDRLDRVPYSRISIANSQPTNAHTTL